MKNYKSLDISPSSISILKRLIILIGFIILPVVILIQIFSLFVQLITQRLTKAKTLKISGNVIEKEYIDELYERE